jgi:hypothetical protein
MRRRRARFHSARRGMARPVKASHRRVAQLLINTLTVWGALIRAAGYTRRLAWGRVPEARVRLSAVSNDLGERLNCLFMQRRGDRPQGIA